MVGRKAKRYFALRERNNYFEESLFVHFACRAVDSIHASASLDGVHKQENRICLGLAQFDSTVRSDCADIRGSFVCDSPDFPVFDRKRFFFNQSLNNGWR
jgi:hypothetical protein